MCASRRHAGKRQPYMNRTTGDSGRGSACVGWARLIGMELARVAPMPAMNLLKHIFTAGMVLAGLVPFLWPLAGIADRSVDRATWALVAVSTVLNVVTIFYHVTMP